jgi:hypothetical protein
MGAATITLAGVAAHALPLVKDWHCQSSLSSESDSPRPRQEALDSRALLLLEGKEQNEVNGDLTLTWCSHLRSELVRYRLTRAASCRMLA